MRSIWASVLVLAVLAMEPTAAQGNPPPLPGPDVPPPLPEAPKVDYFAGIGGKAVGPLTVEKVKEMIAAGEITRATLMWKKGLQAWTEAEHLAEIAAAFDDRPMPLPFDCTAHIVGVWQSSQFVNGQQVVTTARYDAGGQYAGTMLTPGLPGSNFHGTWKATAVGEKSCSVSFNVVFPSTAAAQATFDITDANIMTDKATGTIVRRLE